MSLGIVGQDVSYLYIRRAWLTLSPPALWPFMGVGEWWRQMANGGFTGASLRQEVAAPILEWPQVCGTQ